MEKQKFIRIAAFVYIAAAFGSVGTWSVPLAYAEKGACKQDMEKFCKGVEPGEGRIIKCMKEHEADLSPGCKANLAEREKNEHNGRAACKDDVAKFCKDVQPGQGRIVKCLKEHESDLSSRCKANIQEMEQRREERQDQHKHQNPS